MNTFAKRGHVTPGDRSGVGSRTGVMTEGLRSGERRIAQETKRRCGHDRQEWSTKRPSNGPAGGGPPRAGQSGNEGSPTTRTGRSGAEGGHKHQTGASGTERCGQEMAP